MTDTQSKDWQKCVAPIVAKFKTAAVMGLSTNWNTVGSGALAELIETMAKKLGVDLSLADSPTDEITQSASEAEADVIVGQHPEKKVDETMDRIKDHPYVYGGRNDRILFDIQNLCLDRENFFLRAEEETGDIHVFLNLEGLYVFGGAHLVEIPFDQWSEFIETANKIEDEWTSDGDTFENVYIKNFTLAYGIKLVGKIPVMGIENMDENLILMLDVLYGNEWRSYPEWKTGY